MGAIKAKKEKDEQNRSEVDPVEARAYAEDPELGDDDGEETSAFQALDEGEQAAEREWEKYQESQAKASQPPADDEKPDTAEEARGDEESKEKAETADAGPSKEEETPAEQDTTPKYGGGRYNSLEAFEQGHHELRGTLTQVQQENAALKRQLAGGGQGQQTAPQTANIQDMLGLQKGGKAEALLADEEFQRELELDSAKAIPKLLQANQDDTLNKFMAVLSVADAQKGKRIELAQTQATIQKVGETYIKENHEILLDKDLEPISRSIGHELLGSRLPVNAITRDQAYWRRVASSGPEGLQKYLDKVAELTQKHPAVVRMNAASQPAETEEDLHPPRNMKPGSTQVRPQQPKDGFDDDFDDFAREQEHSDKLWNVL